MIPENRDLSTATGTTVALGTSVSCKIFPQSKTGRSATPRDTNTRWTTTHCPSRRLMRTLVVLSIDDDCWPPVRETREYRGRTNPWYPFSWMMPAGEFFARTDGETCRDKFFFAVWVEQPANPANASSYLPWIESAVVRCRMNATEATMTATVDKHANVQSVQDMASVDVPTCAHQDVPRWTEPGCAPRD